MLKYMAGNSAMVGIRQTCRHPCSAYRPIVISELPTSSASSIVVLLCLWNDWVRYAENTNLRALSQYYLDTGSFHSNGVLKAGFPRFYKRLNLPPPMNRVPV